MARVGVASVVRAREVRRAAERSSRRRSRGRAFVRGSGRSSAVARLEALFASSKSAASKEAPRRAAVRDEPPRPSGAPPPRHPRRSSARFASLRDRQLDRAAQVRDGLAIGAAPQGPDRSPSPPIRLALRDRGANPRKRWAMVAASSGAMRARRVTDVCGRGVRAVGHGRRYWRVAQLVVRETMASLNRREHRRRRRARRRRVDVGAGWIATSSSRDSRAPRSPRCGGARGRRREALDAAFASRSSTTSSRAPDRPASRPLETSPVRSRARARQARAPRTRCRGSRPARASDQARALRGW